MADRTLCGCKILVVEDEYLLADELQTELEEEGVVVLGPFARVADATALIEGGAHIDGAILDANLGGEMAFPAADLLVERAVPFIFTTGYDASVIPIRFSRVERCEKPVSIEQVTAAIARALGAEART